MNFILNANGYLVKICETYFCEVSLSYLKQFILPSHRQMVLIILDSRKRLQWMEQSTNSSFLFLFELTYQLPTKNRIASSTKIPRNNIVIGDIGNIEDMFNNLARNIYIHYRALLW